MYLDIVPKNQQGVQAVLLDNEGNELARHIGVCIRKLVCQPSTFIIPKKLDWYGACFEPQVFGQVQDAFSCNTI